MPTLAASRTETGQPSLLTQANRPLYTRAQLKRLVHPGSIAVLGASDKPGAFGLRTLNNLSDFEGPVYPVNAKYQQIGRYRCYPSLESLPEVPDCVVVALRSELAEDAVRSCIDLGVGGIIMYASGFAETQRPDLVAMQQRLVDMITPTDTRLLGPNCLGVTNYADKARIMFGRTPVSEPLRPGAIGIVTQSGSVSMSLVQMIERGMSVSHAIPIGNAADVDIADLVAYLATDDAWGAIACAFEGVNHPHRLIEAAELAFARDKPLVVFKMASSEQGAVAAMSHSGSLAGSHAAYKAALERAGAILVDNLEDVAETTAFFAKAGRPVGEGVAIVLGSGGLGVCAADKAEEAGVPLPQPTGRTLEILQANVPEFGAARNPCDVTGVALNDVSLLETCAAAMLEDPAYSTLMVVQPYADEAQSARVPLWARLASQHGKVICNLWSTESLVGHGALEVEREPHMATFRSLKRMFGAVAAWHAREKRRMDALETTRLTSPQDREMAAALLRQRRHRTLTEREAKAVLACYGVPVIQERLVASAQDALEDAAELGFPLAMKVESPDILHKTEAGVIRLGLKSAAEVETAFADIWKNAEAVPGARINGVLMQPMVPTGIEMMMGARIDPMFGPLVVVGLGGVMVELMKDTALSPAPVNRPQALAMIAGLRGASALKGFRGMPPVDVERLADILVRFSEFVADHAETVEEIDVNPLICGADRIVAVDALIVTNREPVAGR